MTSTVSAKGQIVIPSGLRKRLGIKKGTRLSVSTRGGELVLKPLSGQYFHEFPDKLDLKGLTVDDLLRERRREKARE